MSRRRVVVSRVDRAVVRFVEKWNGRVQTVVFLEGSRRLGKDIAGVIEQERRCLDGLWMIQGVHLKQNGIDRTR